MTSLLLKSPRGPIIVVAIAVAAVATASALSLPGSASSQGPRAWPSGCPHKAVRFPNFTPAAFASAAKAIHAQIPRVFKGSQSQGSPAWPHAQITALVSANGTPVNPEGWPPPLNGVTRYKTTAVKACGRAIASASLVAFLYFPACQIPCASDFAYVTLTRRGWRLWMSHRESYP